ncbi:MAG: HlyD family secretion protein [bacterium]
MGNKDKKEKKMSGDVVDFASADVETALEVEEMDNSINEAVEEQDDVVVAPKKSPLVGIIFIAVLLVGAVVGFRYWQYASTHITTDDAYLTAEITSIAPQVGGTVQKVLVADNQIVKKGDLLVQLDDASYRATLDQAKANLDAAVAQAEGAGISVDLTTMNTQAQLQQAQGGLGQAESGVNSAIVDTSRTSAAYEKALLAKSIAESALTAAQARVSAANAGVNSATASAEKAHDDANRYQELLKSGAVSEQMANQMQTSDKIAQANLENNVQQLNAAKEAVIQAEGQINIAASDIAQAEAQKNLSRETIAQAKAKTAQARGQVNQANTRPTQIALSNNAKSQALAKVEQAQAAVTAAQIQFNNTRIYAPVDGMVGEKSVVVGALVAPGTPLLALVQTDKLWIVANFKETQLMNMHIGQAMEFDVDALGKAKFSGTVDSISAATGATFALLPPDNASGNFTKVVQRIPVKLAINEKQPGYERLRAGMSVSVSVATR